MAPRDLLPKRWARLRRTGKAARVAIAGTARHALWSSGEANRRTGAALVEELDALKGLAMKVGQILSYLDVGLPEETQDALRTLQRGVTPLSFAAAEDVLRDAFGADAGALFDHLDPVPIAAASIGQVHRGTWRGQPVAVKVQYPGIRETIDADAAQLTRLGRIASMATSVDGHALVAELHARLREECDYALEARHLLRFRSFFHNDPAIVLPGLIAERSAETVLTTTWCDGEGLAGFLERADAAAHRRAGMTLARFTWTALWRHGVLHGDPHPGNQRFRDDAVVFLDFGCVRVFSDEFLAAERRLLVSVLAGDRRGFRAACRDSGVVGSARFDFDAHWEMMRYLWGPYLAPRGALAADYMVGARRFFGPQNRNLQRMGIPPQAIWMMRVSWGLHAVMARLQTAGPLGDMLREILED